MTQLSRCVSNKSLYNELTKEKKKNTAHTHEFFRGHYLCASLVGRVPMHTHG